MAALLSGFRACDSYWVDSTLTLLCVPSWNWAPTLTHFFLKIAGKIKTRRRGSLLANRHACPSFESQRFIQSWWAPLVLLALPAAAAVRWVATLSHRSPFYPHIKPFASTFILVLVAYRKLWQTVLRTQDIQAGELDLEPKRFHLQRLLNHSLSCAAFLFCALTLMRVWMKQEPQRKISLLGPVGQKSNKPKMFRSCC